MPRSWKSWGMDKIFTEEARGHIHAYITSRVSLPWGHYRGSFDAIPTKKKRPHHSILRVVFYKKRLDCPVRLLLTTIREVCFVLSTGIDWIFKMEW